MKRVKVKVKGTPNLIANEERRLSRMDACPGFEDAPSKDERRFDKLYRKKKLGESQYPTAPKEGFKDEASGYGFGLGSLRGIGF